MMGTNFLFWRIAVGGICAWTAACSGNAAQPTSAPAAPPRSASPAKPPSQASQSEQPPIDQLLTVEDAEPPPTANTYPRAGTQPRRRQPEPVLSGVHAQPASRAGGASVDAVQNAAPNAASAQRRSAQGLTRGVGDEADRELSLGDAAFARSEYDQALVHYRAARRLIPKEPAPLVGIAIARLASLGIPTEFAGAPKDARIPGLVRLLEQALKLDKQFGPAHLQLGRLFLIKGDGQKAALSLTRAVQLLPNDPEAHSAMAVAALTQGDVVAAVRGFERAAELEPNHAERLTNLGTAYMMHGDAQKAISAYRKAVSLAPNDARARGDLGTALLATQNIKGALPHLERAHALAPERATFMSNLGYALQQQGDLAKATAWYKKALDKDPKLGSAWINMGIVHAEQGDFKAAKQAFEKALSLDPTDPRAKANLEELKQEQAKDQPPSASPE